MRPRICIGIDATQANKDRKTGTEWYAFRLIREFKKMIPQEFEVRLYSPEPLKGELGILPPHFQSRVLRWPLGFLWNHLRLSWEMLWHPVDLLYVPSHVIPLIHPKRTVTTIHDVGFEEDASLYNVQRIGPKNPFLARMLGLVVRVATLGKYTNTEYDYHRFGARFAAKHAIHLLTISEFSKQKIQQFYHVADDRLTIVMPSHDTDVYCGPSSIDTIERTCNAYHISRPYFFYIGRLEEKKNILNLVKAFHQFIERTHQPHCLVLVGNEGYGYEHVQSYLEQHDLSARVLRPGYVKEEDLPALFTGATAFVFPSRYEGFGIPLLQAFATHTPVIASTAGSIPEVVGDAALLSDPDDVELLSQHLQQVIEDPDMRTSLIEKGSRRVQDFSPRKTAEGVWHALERFLNLET